METELGINTIQYKKPNLGNLPQFVVTASTSLQLLVFFSGPATSFLPFRHLPTKLRLKIWGYAAQVPQIIEIEWGPIERNGKHNLLFDNLGFNKILLKCRKADHINI